jgi:CRISPR system Cascade subunit CasE
MIYLTQSNIDFATAARRRLRDSYDWHQAVWEAFPGREGAQRDFLTRLDERSECFRLLVVSPSEPSRPGWCTPGSASWQTRTIPDAFFDQGRYAFQLCANPTKKVAKLLADGSPTKNGRRTPLRTREELVAWLVRKATDGGFTFDSQTLRCFPRGRARFLRKDPRGLHSAVEFQGTLTVNDSAGFRESFGRGIGPAKAFGFGMLVIAPIY